MTDRQTDQQTHIMAYMEVTNNCSSKNCIKKGKERELKVGGGGGVRSAELGRRRRRASVGRGGGVRSAE